MHNFRKEIEGTFYHQFQCFYSVAKATLESQMFVCWFVCLSVRPLSKYLSLSESCLSAKSQPSFQPAIVPISHHATQPPCRPPSQPLSIITIGHDAYQPSCPCGLLTYALFSRLLSLFGLFPAHFDHQKLRYASYVPCDPVTRSQSKLEISKQSRKKVLLNHRFFLNFFSQLIFTTGG